LRKEAEADGATRVARVITPEHQEMASTSLRPAGIVGGLGQMAFNLVYGRLKMSAFLDFKFLQLVGKVIELADGFYKGGAIGR